MQFPLAYRQLIFDIKTTQNKLERLAPANSFRHRCLFVVGLASQQRAENGLVVALWERVPKHDNALYQLSYLFN